MKHVLVFGMHDLYGGVEAYLSSVVERMQGKEFQFDFISKFSPISCEKELINRGCKVIYVPDEKSNPVGNYRAITRVLKEYSYDIVYVNMLSAANPIPLLAAYSSHVSHVVVHSHNSGMPSGILRKVMHRLNCRLIAKLSTDQWACSQAAGDFLFPHATRLKIIPNAIDSQKFSFDAEMRRKVRNRYGIPEGCTLIGHVGRFEEQKNHKRLIQIFKSYNDIYPNSKMMLIGSGKSETEMKQLAEHLGLSQDVLFLGQRKDAACFYNAMDLFLFPSTFEGLGIVLLEAQACGLPCVTSEAIQPEVIVKGAAPFTQVQLSSSNQEWAKCMNLSLKKGTNRINAGRIIRRGNLDINNAAAIIRQRFEQV